MSPEGKKELDKIRKVRGYTLPLHDALAETNPEFLKRYGDVFKGPKQWQAIQVEAGAQTYRWSDSSTYVKNPPYFDGLSMTPAPVKDVQGARILGLFLDSITTDHISPAGSIAEASPAGQWLISRGVLKADFNSYGARRGHHEVMMRGTFANVRIQNRMLPPLAGVLGGSVAEVANPQPLWLTIAKTLLQVAAFIAIMLVAGRRVFVLGADRSLSAIQAGVDVHLPAQAAVVCRAASARAVTWRSSS